MAAKKKSASKRKYGAKAQKTVAKTLRGRKKGTLKSGGSGRKVKSRKQAIAIALSEARRSGAKVPKRKGAKKKGAKKRATKKSATKKSATKKSATKKRATKKRGTGKRKSS